MAARHPSRSQPDLLLLLFDLAGGGVWLNKNSVYRGINFNIFFFGIIELHRVIDEVN